MSPSLISLSICVVALVGFAPASLPPPAHASAGSALFDSLGSDDFEASLPEALAKVSPAQRQAFESRLARKQSFHSLLIPPKRPAEFPAEVVFGAQQRVERGAFTLTMSPRAARDAADLARSARLSYEWEGYPDGPMAEAQSAQRHLTAHPTTSVTDYIQLFLMHRYRSAFEAAERTITRDLDYVAPEFRQSRGQALTKMRLYAAVAYRAAWERATKSRDEVAVAIANDIDAAPYVYVQSREHPRTFKDK